MQPAGPFFFFFPFPCSNHRRTSIAAQRSSLRDKRHWPGSQVPDPTTQRTVRPRVTLISFGPHPIQGGKLPGLPYPWPMAGCQRVLLASHMIIERLPTSNVAFDGPDAGRGCCKAPTRLWPSHGQAMTTKSKVREYSHGVSPASPSPWLRL